MNKKALVKKYILLIIGLFFSGVGIAFTKHGELGVSPISSVANVMSLKFSFFTMGSWLIIWNCVLILGQIIILRKDFKVYQLLQIPLSFLFGYFTDIGMKIVSFIPVNSYFVKLLMLFIGIAVLAFGISLSVIANAIMNSGEAIVKAISDKTGFEFGNVKVVFDVSCVVVSVVLSLIFFDMKILGTREGTVISAVLTGFVVKFFTKLLKEKLSKLIKAK